ncbi:MAG: domain protein (2Fe-2S)-binding domain protein [Pelosinus sp.]|jgi:bacterioferritin-associated ferredoxin|nr:domain protein (2Fe-2S)-binding domain protein [Pelosinus sp.]
MSEDVNQEILDKLTKVCICKAISKASIKKIIASGANTLEQVQHECGAGSGPCGGKRCTPKIKELLENQA